MTISGSPDRPDRRPGGATSGGNRFPGRPVVRASFVAALLCGLAALAAFSGTGLAGSARDYLSAPVDIWLTFYNLGYSTSVTPEDSLDVTSSIRSNVLSQSLVVTRTMDFWGNTGGISVILPYLNLAASSDAFCASNQGLSDIGLLWQMNIFGAPALTREQFQSFFPQTFSSFHLFVGAPLGKYDPVNLAEPQFEPLDLLSDDQLQLHARPGLDIARRDLSIDQAVHGQCRLPRCRRLSACRS